MRMPYPRSKAFFSRMHPTDQDIQKWPMSKTTKTFVVYILFLIACTFLGSIVGLGYWGTTQGFLYAFVVTFLGVVCFRWLMMQSASVHPLTSSRWFNFAGPFTIIFFFVWVMAYLGWMPRLVGPLMAPGSILSHQVSISPSVSIPAFGLVLLIGLAGALVGIAVGLLFASLQDGKNKARLLSQLHRWQQGNS
jgi:hypothetical protein